MTVVVGRHVRTVVAIAACAAAVLEAAPLRAQGATPLPSLVAWPAAVGVTRSASRPAPAPEATLRGSDAWKLGVVSAAALLVSTADRRGDAWARRPAVRNDATLRTLSRVGDVTGTWIAVGAGPATYALGRLRGDSAVQVMGLRTTESVVLAGTVIAGLKALSGRTRPYASADNSPTHWKLFGGLRSDSTRSFASGHSALSAAAAVSLAAEWRRQGRAGWRTVGPPLVYSLATITAGSRVRDRQHWLSDVVTGAAVGAASAIVVRRWHDAHPRSRLDRALIPH